MRERALGWLLSCLALTSAAGCGRALEEEMAEGMVQASLETTRSGSAGQPLLRATERTCPVDPEAIAAEAALKSPVGLYPASCVTKTANGNTVHSEFADCTGAFGRVQLNGGLDAILESADECGIHAEIVDSGDLTANGRSLDYEASAYMTFRDGHRDIDWQARFSGTTKRGRSIRQSSKLAITIDEATSCVALNGDIDGRVGKRLDYSASIEGLSVCPEACPTSGVVQAKLEGRLRDRTLTLRFDGSNVAHATGWTGREFDVDMVCDE
jgi:hypothetical protein